MPTRKRLLKRIAAVLPALLAPPTALLCVIWFRGGKGFAAYLAVTLSLDWKFALVLYAVLIVLLVVTDYVVVCTFTTITVVPIWFAVRGQYATAVLMLIPSLVILYKHRENIRHLREGTEIGLRSAGRGDHRVKK